MQVAEVYVVVVHDSERPHPRGGEVQQRRRAQPACPDHEDFCILEPTLTGRSDFGNNEVARVPFDLFGGQPRGRFHEWRQR
ncbi:hypothetical protein GCM10027038_25770 [Arthrobacter bambusae]